jgi:hypothetical protein
VQSHLKIFPDGATAQAARHRIQSLEREREATANWRDIASTSQPEVFEHFLERFPDSPLAAEASARLVELRRMQEMMDWNAARDARHPAALLRFLRLYPNSERTLEAYEKLEALPKTIEREAWSEIENSDQPILYQAYLRALPFSENAKLASAKLKMLTKLTAAPIDATLDRGTKFWTSTRFPAGIGAAGTIMVLATAAALAGGQRPFVAGALLLAAIALDFAAILLFFVGPRLYSDPQGPLRSSIEFYAFGSMAILLWITLTQAISAQTGEGALNMLAFSIVAMVALLAQKYNRLRSVLYVLVPLVGLYYVARAFGAPTYDFITANLYGAGGAALFVLSLVVINARRKAQKAGRES